MDDLVPIQAIDLLPNSIINFDLYIYLPVNNKYILYRKKESLFDAGLKDKFAQFNISNFYVKKEDYPLFVEYMSKALQGLMEVDKSVEKEKVLTATVRNLLYSTLSTSHTTHSQQLVDNLNAITSKMIDTNLRGTSAFNAKTFQNISKIAKNGTNFQKHPVNVNSLSLLIAIGLGYNNPKVLAELSMAAVLHDLGLSRIPPELAVREADFDYLSDIEKEQMRKHPFLTLEVLKENKIKITELTETIILQHHERYDGTGYPRGLKGFMINEFSMIVHLADEIDHKIGLSKASNSDLIRSLRDPVEMARLKKIIQPQLLNRILSVLT